ncbi:MAG: neutral/alkaline non-lysosomal ceramidase N-terminal domain-containing protein [Verrucomicrobiales bacterium]|nr:neutral/alkaline non-lysosomal ceramidase N-terminal domain-containing protein [Verrucomicrobiales bacterium]
MNRVGMTGRNLVRRTGLWLGLGVGVGALGVLAAPVSVEVGLAVRDVSPELPIRLAGYAGRQQPADRAEHPLLVQALALRNPTGERFVFVALDNCEVSGEFMAPVLQQCRERYQLPRGAVAVVSSHTHSAPVLESTLTDMTQPTTPEREQIVRYSRRLQQELVAVVGAALETFEPATLEHGLGRATFAMNRRVYRGDQVVFGDNPDGPVDWDVPVLRIRRPDGAVRAIVFGYACHGTSVRGGEDWHVVSGEYMAYARQHLEAMHPGAVALYLTGMGADIDPAPRGRLLDARRHGLQLAGAVLGVLDRPMRPVRGGFRMAYDEVELPFVPPPGRDRLEADARSADVHVRQRAEAYLKRMDAGQPVPRAVRLPVAVVRVGEDLTFLLAGGEVVVDYARRWKRLLAQDHPWPVGYAYEVPCYIPSVRLLKEGGYEADSSFIYYGFYGPFDASIEDRLVDGVSALVSGLRGP